MKKRADSKISFNVILLGIASLLNDIGSEMIVPIMPLFLSALGGGGLIIGLVGGLRDSISNILKVAAGYVSDRIGRKKIFVFWGYLISAVFKFFLAFSKTAGQALVFSSFERVGKLRDAPRDVIIAESTKGRKGRSFGLHQAFDRAGGIIGAVLVLFLFWIFGFSFTTIMIAASAFSFLSAFPVLFVREAKGKPQRQSFFGNLKKIPKNTRFFFLIAGIFALANFSYMFFLLRAGELFSGRMAVLIPILLYILYLTFYTSFNYYFGILADRIGKRRVIAGGFILFALTVLGFVFAKSIWLFALLFILYGLSFAMIESNQRALVAELSPKKIRGSSIGAFHTLIGLLALPASLIAGILWNVSHAGVFVYGFVVSLIAVIMLAGFRARD